MQNLAVVAGRIFRAADDSSAELPDGRDFFGIGLYPMLPAAASKECTEGSGEGVPCLAFIERMVPCTLFSIYDK